MDHASPGWETHIDVRTFDMGDYTRCIIGQIHPGGHGYFSYTELFGGARWAKRFGFESRYHYSLRAGNALRKEDAEEVALQQAWLNEIGGRIVTSIVKEVSATSEKELVDAGN